MSWPEPENGKRSHWESPSKVATQVRAPKSIRVVNSFNVHYILSLRTELAMVYIVGWEHASEKNNFLCVIYAV